MGFRERCRRIRWRWMAVAVVLTLAGFTILVQLGGAKYNFYHRCAEPRSLDHCHSILGPCKPPPYNPWVVFTVHSHRHTLVRSENAIVNEIWSLETRGLLKRSYLQLRNERPVTQLVILNQLTYPLLATPLFFFAPLILAWRLRKGARLSSLLAIPMCWAGATLIGRYAFDFFTVGLALSTLIVWGAAGVAAVTLGQWAAKRNQLKPDERT